MKDIQNVFVKSYAAAAKKVRKSYFKRKGKSQCRNVIDLLSFERTSLVLIYARYEVSVTYDSKVIAKV